MRHAFQRCLPSLLPIVRSSTCRSSRLLTIRPQIRSSQCSNGLPRSLIRSFHQIRPLRNQDVSEPVAEVQDTKSAPITRFEELESRGILHRNIVQNLTRNGLEVMTDVQSATINEALKGQDIIAQAKTGTGKTLAFLLPVLQNIINVDPSLAQRVDLRRGPRSTADDIRAIVISPTRELAEQIAVEARKVVKGTGIIVQTAVGGTQKAAGLRAIQRQGCHILVGTPGRLNDLLSDERSRVEAPDLSALVLDEADRLLDEGFWDSIKEIMSRLPSRQVKNRQTLMFSATVPKEIVGVVRSTLKPGFQFVRCVRDDEAPTHDRVPQHVFYVNGLENKIPALVEYITRNVEQSQEPGAQPFKAIVYCNSTADVALTTAVLRGLRSPETGSSLPIDERNRLWGNLRIQEIHAKLTQAQRTRAAENFRRCTTGVLLSSDVTARGMDFPNVTHVIQMSSPPNREQYIHRIGRTARAGKDGVAVLFLTQSEDRDCRAKLRGMKLVTDDSLTTTTVDMTKASQVSAEAGRTLSVVQKSMSEVPVEIKNTAFKSLLGANRGGISTHKLIPALNNLALYGWGLPSPPPIEPGLAQKLGLSRIPGIVIGSSRSDREGYTERSAFPRRDRDSTSSDFRRSRSADSYQGSSRYSRGSFDRGSRDGGEGRMYDNGFSNDRRSEGRRYGQSYESNTRQTGRYGREDAEI